MFRRNSNPPAALAHLLLILAVATAPRFLRNRIASRQSDARDTSETGRSSYDTPTFPPSTPSAPRSPKPKWTF